MITVVNKHKHKPTLSDVYIGRGSALGNPFKIGEHGTRAEVIAKYEAWLKEQIIKNNFAVIAEIKHIQKLHHEGKDVCLVCYCAPQPCHGDFIKKLVDYVPSNP